MHKSKLSAFPGTEKGWPCFGSPMFPSLMTYLFWRPVLNLFMRLQKGLRLPVASMPWQRVRARRGVKSKCCLFSLDAEGGHTKQGQVCQPAVFRLFLICARLRCAHAYHVEHDLVRWFIVDLLFAVCDVSRLLLCFCFAFLGSLSVCLIDCLRFENYVA